LFVVRRLFNIIIHQQRNSSDTFSGKGNIALFLTFFLHILFLVGITLVVLSIIRIFFRTYCNETAEYSCRYKVAVGVLLAGIVLLLAYYFIDVLMG